MRSKSVACRLRNASVAASGYCLRIRTDDDPVGPLPPPRRRRRRCRRHHCGECRHHARAPGSPGSPGSAGSSFPGPASNRRHRVPQVHPIPRHWPHLAPSTTPFSLMSGSGRASPLPPPPPLATYAGPQDRAGSRTPPATCDAPYLHLPLTHGAHRHGSSPGSESAGATGPTAVCSERSALAALRRPLRRSMHSLRCSRRRMWCGIWMPQPSRPRLRCLLHQRPRALAQTSGQQE
jgi:hypothetical protein